MPNIPSKYANEINKAKKGLRNTIVNKEGTNDIKEKILNSGLIGRCKYCDPAWSYVSNFAEAVKGYDVPMGNPYPGCYNNYDKQKLKSVP